MTKIYFVRHAEPDYSNHDDRTRELSRKGLIDREFVTEFLSDKQIDIVISSPFKRAVDTIKPFSEKYGFDIEIIEDFRERKVGTYWIKDFSDFSKKQWEDFDYKLSGGECLREVQERNIEALKYVLQKYPEKNIVIGCHGTALSTVINYYNYYDNSFDYYEFEKIKNIMPLIAEMEFDENAKCTDIRWFALNE